MTVSAIRVMYMAMDIKVVKPIEPVLFKRKKVAAYARVSVETELSQHSLANQVQVYKSFIESKPEWIFAGVYADEAYTGTKLSRPGFQRMLKDCNEGKIDIILTKSISRFARNTVDLLNVTRDLRSKEIDIHFERENINTLTADGDFLLTLLASFAEAEARSVSENTLWSIRKRFEQGLGNSFIIYGYRWDGEKFNIIEEEAKIVRLIFQKYLEGNGPKLIAHFLENMGIRNRRGNFFTYPIIAQMLRCEKYVGNSLFQKTFTTDFITKKKLRNKGERLQYLALGTHPQIIDKDTFEMVQKEIERRAELGYFANQKMHFTCFTSKLICGNCKSAYRKRMTGLTGRHKTRTYKWMCSTKIEGTSKACPSQNIPDRALVLLTAEVLKTDDFDKELFDSNIDHIEVGEHNTLTYILKNGSSVDKHWLSVTPNKKMRDKINGNISNTNSCD